MYLNILTQLFTDFTARDSWTILAYLFGSFLFGLLTYWVYFAGAMSKVKEVLRQREAALAVAQDEANALKARVTKGEEEVKRTNQVVDELHTIQRRIETEKKTYQADALNAKSKIDQIQTDNTTLNVQIQSLGEQIVGLRAQSNDLTGKIYEKDKALASLTDMTSNFNSSTSRVKALEEQIKLLEGDRNQLKEELSRFKVGDVRVASGSPLNSTVVTNRTTVQPPAPVPVVVVEAPAPKVEETPAPVAPEAPIAVIPAPTAEEIAALDTPSDMEDDAAETTIQGEVATATPTVTTSTLSSNARSVFTGSPANNLPEDPISRGKAAIKAAFGVQLSKAPMGTKDDLKQIVGIGPFLEERLNSLGICTYQQLTQLDENLIAALTDAIQFLPGRIKKDDWSGQAKLLMEG
jgi:predicted flap endonuclease-1-like 5' DNA nuclease/outer membrane murein-binding lipoprotein Lpp